MNVQNENLDKLTNTEEVLRYLLDSEQHKTQDIRSIFEKCFEVYQEDVFDKGAPAKDAFLKMFTEYVILPNKHKIPTLFRYSSADYFNIRNLETETLMLSSTHNMNDVFEGLSGFANDLAVNELDELKDIAFIKCFSENKNDLLMWSHYGDSYKGMCVEYDFSKLSDDILFHLFPVMYSNKRYPITTLSNAVNDLYEVKKANKEKYYPDLYESLMDIMSMFLKKPECWQYEAEWRIIATYAQIYNAATDFDGEIENAVLYNINDKIFSVKDCIKAVYLGPKIPQVQKNHIIDIVSSKSNVKLFELILSDSEYNLQEQPIR